MKFFPMKTQIFFVSQDLVWYKSIGIYQLNSTKSRQYTLSEADKHLNPLGRHWTPKSPPFPQRQRFWVSSDLDLKDEKAYLCSRNWHVLVCQLTCILLTLDDLDVLHRFDLLKEALE